MLGLSCAPEKKDGAASLAVSSPDGSLIIALSLEAKPQPYLAGERA
ncbi:MAG: hypothetical protein IMZ46_03295 [Acidobacteria bacterium]|nr:hypothetical protein [Acidobacteriota bacterium]